MVDRRSPLQDAPATAPVSADTVRATRTRAIWLTTEVERAEARADYAALGWPHDAIEREIAALGPTAEEAERLPAAELEPRGLMPFDVPVPPSWRDPAKMAAAVQDAVAALRANPKATQAPRVTIFRAVSRLTDAVSRATGLPKSLSPDVLDALAHGLGIAGKVRRRIEARKVQSATSRGFPASAVAVEGTDRTARRRKHEQYIGREWPDAAAVVASVERLATIRESSATGGWGETACLTLYDAALWFADRAQPLPHNLWWAIALAMGLAVQVDGEGRFTDDTVGVLWGSPTPRADLVTEAARRYAAAELTGGKPLSNRGLAEELGVRPAVIDRLVKTLQWGMALRGARIWARYNKTPAAPQADTFCLAAKADCPQT